MKDSDRPVAASATPFAAMLRAGIVVAGVVFPVVVVLFWVLDGSKGGLSAALGALVALVFFAGGLATLNRVVGDNPMLMLAAALAVYLGQTIFLGVVIFSLSGQHWLDGWAFGLAVLIVALVWQAAQITAYIRAPKPVYDLPEPASNEDPEQAA